MPDAPETICQIADRIVSGERNTDYGHPADDYSATTAAFNAITRRDGDRALTMREGLLFMLCVKLSREGHKHKRDSLVDLCGYAKCLDIVEGEK